MLRVESNTKLEEFEGFTEFEDGLLFDEDIPGFCNTVRPFIYGLQREMSIASVHHPAELHSNHSSLTTLSHSLEDLKGASWNSPPLHSDHVMTIEELRSQMTSCFTCGVSWNDKHVSLDCKECGGYALERPCPDCEGACGSVWKRDLSMSHASSKARWEGECAQNKPQQPLTSATSDVITAQELSTKLEKLSANS